MSNIFGKRLRMAIGNSGKRQEDVANVLGVDRSSISHWVNNRHTPNPEQIKTLARVLNVTTDYLLGIDSEEWFSKLPLDLKEFIKDEMLNGNDYLKMANYIKKKRIGHDVIRSITDSLTSARDKMEP